MIAACWKQFRPTFPTWKYTKTQRGELGLKDDQHRLALEWDCGGWIGAALWECSGFDPA